MTTIEAIRDDFAFLDEWEDRYRYVIEDSRPPDLFMRPYYWRVYNRLDIDAMTAAAAPLVPRMLRRARGDPEGLPPQGLEPRRLHVAAARVLRGVPRRAAQ